MLLAALLDAGAPLAELERAADLLGLGGTVRLRRRQVRLAGLRATRLEVAVEGPPWDTVGEMIARLRERVPEGWARRRAEAALGLLAEAEARVHGPQPGHLHELGSADTLLDVYGVFRLLEVLGVAQVYASPLPAGTGSREMAHGRYPLPAPVTLELLAGAHAPLRPAPAQDVELVTPTAAAILAAGASFRQPELCLERVGYGAGHSQLPWPNLVRVWVGAPQTPPGEAVVLEASLDDATGEELGEAVELLLEAGALDAFLVPYTGKKSRPGVILTVLGRPEMEETLARLILAHTPTLGLRVREARRYEAARSTEEVTTAYGTVRLKLKYLEGELVSASPEFEDCRRLAREQGVSAGRVAQAALQAFRAG